MAVFEEWHTPIEIKFPSFAKWDTGSDYFHFFWMLSGVRSAIMSIVCAFQGWHTNWPKCDPPNSTQTRRILNEWHINSRSLHRPDTNKNRNRSWNIRLKCAIHGEQRRWTIFTHLAQIVEIRLFDIKKGFFFLFDEDVEAPPSPLFGLATNASPNPPLKRIVPGH
jgi:hypothetical protein